MNQSKDYYQIGKRLFTAIIVACIVITAVVTYFGTRNLANYSIALTHLYNLKNDIYENDDLLESGAAYERLTIPNYEQSWEYGRLERIEELKQMVQDTQDEIDELKDADFWRMVTFGDRERFSIVYREATWWGKRRQSLVGLLGMFEYLVTCLEDIECSEQLSFNRTNE